MTLSVGLGVIAALAAAVLYSLGVTLQAIEARLMPSSDALRASLLRHLIVRRRWILGTVCVIGGWIMQAVALMLAPITVVQPALAISVVALLVIGTRWFGQPARLRDTIAAVAITVGVGGLVVAAPGHSEGDAAPVMLAVGMSVLGIVALAPFLLPNRARTGWMIAVSAGLAYAWTAFSTKFVADGLSSGEWIVALIWLGATIAGAGIGLVSEMTALQHSPAIRVFPIVLVVQIVVAVLLAPLLAGESWSPDPLVVAGLGVSLAVVAAATRALAGATAVEAAIAATDP